MVFARDWFSSPLSVAVARTSQSPFPLPVMLKDDTTIKNSYKNRIDEGKN